LIAGTAAPRASPRFPIHDPTATIRNQETSKMAYTVDGVELETDEQGYLLEPDYGEEVVRVIAAAEGITLNGDHWKVVNYLRDEYREHGHTPNFRNMLKGLEEILPGCDSKSLYELFPTGPAKQGAKVAGLPQPLGKGGY
jgi:tRNA 2-thiouridine synthesizing protein E